MSVRLTPVTSQPKPCSQQTLEMSTLSCQTKMRCVCAATLMKSAMRCLTSHNISHPIGGKLVPYFKDFRHYLPVITGQILSQIIQACVKKAPLCRQFLTLQLTQNVQLTALQKYSTLILTALVSEISFSTFWRLHPMWRKRKSPFLSSASLVSNVHYFGWAITSGIESSCVLYDWHT